MQERNTAGGWPLQNQTSHDTFSSLAKKQREFHPFAFFRSPKGRPFRGYNHTVTVGDPSQCDCCNFSVIKEGSHIESSLDACTFLGSFHFFSSDNSCSSLPYQKKKNSCSSLLLTILLLFFGLRTKRSRAGLCNNRESPTSCIQFMG